MKRFLAILLMLAMLLPMGLTVQAEETEIKPFSLLTWAEFDNEYKNVYYMPFFWSNSAKIEQGIANVSCPGLGGSGISGLAENLKEYFDKVPEGSRFINFCMVHDAVYANIQDACFMDGAVPLVSGWVEQFFAEYKRIGGKIDGLFTVVEYMPIYASYIQGEFFSKDKYIYDKIVNNPIYQEKIRPQLVERGFKFYSPATKETPELYSLHSKSGSEYATSRSIWDTVMRSYLGKTVADCCAPLWKYYPDAVVSDYQSKDIKPWVKEISDGGGVLGGGGIQTGGGNASNDNFSFNRPDKDFFTGSNGPVYRNIPAYNNAILENTEFNSCLFDANIAKSMYLSSDNGNLTYWLVPFYRSRNAYYAETVIHMGMVDPNVYHGYIIKGDCGDDPEKYELALKVVDDCLENLNKMVGAADRKPIAVDPNWNHSFVLSGMNAGGKNVWRITPDTTKTTVEAFKIKDSDPTFALAGETITFPQGKIVEDVAVADIGTCGYWVETPENVMPVITRDKDHFRNNPAFQENYEAYEAGMEYSYDNAKPVTCWEPKKNGTGSATVVTDPTNANNKVLELKGSFTLKNTTILKNITAGDTYAENQAWEVSFTLPADMASDGELVLLNAAGEKKKSDDGGFKIAGGKIYYSKAGEYTELEGVTLTAGTRYTVLRDMDFTNADAITCDYYVYGADGSLLGSAMDVAVAPITIPVGSVSMTCKNIAGGAVLLDDYKLYPTHVATDMYLYDAKLGMKIEDQEKAHNGGVAYRLSWLNGTQEEKTYSVMAAYYNGETLVEEKAVSELKMAPGGDGVITGIVDNTTQGQTLKVYLRDDTPVQPEENGAADGDADKNPADADKGMTMVIIIAAAAIAVVAAVVIIAVTLSKKKKKPAAEE